MHHGTSLFVAIDSIELSKDALLHQNGHHLGQTWGELFLKRDKKKSTKFSSMILENYDTFFTPTMQGGNAERDSITGEEFLPTEKIYYENGLKLKQLTKQQIDLGKKLRETDLIVIKEGDALDYWNDKTHIEPIGIGYTYYFLNDSDISEMKERLRASADLVSVITMNGKNGDCDFLRTLDGINNIYALDFYGGNEVDKKVLLSGKLF